jgi:sterol desaturase/sphingolipid hydroxylase (fatty acid hydroxylase superfamily)
MFRQNQVSEQEADRPLQRTFHDTRRARPRRQVRKENRPVPTWLSAVLVSATFLALLWRELRQPLRPRVENKSRRTVRNFAVASLSAAALHLTERPATGWLTALVLRRRLGILKRLNLPRWLDTALSVCLLDYTLYLWHVLTHKVAFLWRFHQVHHVDLDLDASTALRFHFGEMTISVLFRSAQIVLIGVSPRALSIWNTALLMSVIFHHSNARLPYAMEWWLSRILVTPRMHGIHHSVVREEADSNWSSGLSLWDWLHGTLLLNVPQDELTIGVPAFRDPAETTFPKLVAMPFVEQRDSWQLPGGETPARHPSHVPTAELLP